MERFVDEKPPGEARRMCAHESEVDLKLFRKIRCESHFFVSIVPFEKNVFPFDSKPRAYTRPVLAQLAHELHDALETASDPVLDIAFRCGAINRHTQQVQLRPNNPWHVRITAVRCNTDERSGEMTSR